MKTSLKAGLIAGLVVALAIGGIEAAFATTENDLFQFCTTKAYGWPAPWKIDYCECEGGRTVYPKSSKVVNAGAVAGGGVAGFVFFGGLALLRQRRR